MPCSASNPSNCQSRKYRDSRNCFFSMFSPASITRTCTVGSALNRCHPPMPSSSLHTYERSAIVVRGLTSPMKACESGIGCTYSSSSLPRPQPPPTNVPACCLASRCISVWHNDTNSAASLCIPGTHHILYTTESHVTCSK